MSNWNITHDTILPGKPEITDCKAGDKTGVTLLDVMDIKQLETGAEQYLGSKKILAVIGPLACKLCDRECEDAYAIITDQVDINVLTSNGVTISETSVQLGKRNSVSVNSTREQQDKPAEHSHPSLQADPSLQAEPGTEYPKDLPFNGWNYRLTNMIMNDLIDVTRANVVTVDQSGDLALHAAFQDTLPFEGDQSTDRLTLF